MQAKGSAAVAILGESLNRIALPLDWLRLTVTDRAGKRAWMKPVRGAAFE